MTERAEDRGPSHTMKAIVIPWPKHEDHEGEAVEQVVIVSWFPPLTEDQIVANVFAAEAQRPEPFPDPNWIKVRLER